MEDRYLGLISGTSVDAVDAALVAFEGGGFRLMAARSYPLPEAFRQRLLALGPTTPLAEVAAADAAVADHFATAANALLAESGQQPAGIRAIGSHGQTVWHRPEGNPPLTVQIGDPNRIAEQTGIDVVADFRRRDLAAGGEAAPLAPAFHADLFRTAAETRAVLNLGGIANLTILPSATEEPVLGFDSGPANALLDRWADRHLGEPLDRDGRWAAAGSVQQPLLRRLLDDPYFRRSPPKSTGPEHFGLHWLEPRLAGETPVDVQATLAALTVATVTDALHRHVPAVRTLLVCGGGVHNAFLMDSIRAALPGCDVRSTASEGLDPDFVEAAAFAWLARQAVTGRPGNLPEVTGARYPLVLGGLYRGRS